MIKHLLRALVALAIVSATPAAAQVQWNYSFVNNQATATYLGDVVINGACTGCGGGGGGVSLSTAQTWTATQSFLPSTSLGIVVNNIGEHSTVFASAPTATVNYDVLAQSVQLYTVAAANNWTLNIRGSSGSTLNSVMAIGQTVTIAFLATEGSTAFYNSAVQIDGVAVTPKWQGGAPSAGNASGIDSYTYTVVKTAASTYTVLASQVQFK